MNYNYYKLFEMKIVNNKYSKLIKWFEKYFPHLYYKKCYLDGHVVYLQRWITIDKEKEVNEFVEKYMKLFNEK